MTEIIAIVILEMLTLEVIMRMSQRSYRVDFNNNNIKLTIKLTSGQTLSYTVQYILNTKGPFK